MRSSIFFRLVRTPQWRCLRTTRQRWPSCGIRGAPEPRFLGWTAHDLLRWAERHSTSLLPQFIMGHNTVLANFVLSSQSNSGFRVDPETVSVSAASEKVAGVTRPVRNLTNSSLLTLFFSVPQFQCSWDRGSSQTMGWVAGVCFSSLCAYSCDSVNCFARPLGSC